MSQYQRLLLIADHTLPHSPAAQRAVALATASGAALHITALVQLPPRIHLIEQSMDEKALEAHLEKYREWLSEVVGAMRTERVQITSEAILAEKSLEEILLHVREMTPDMLIKDVHVEPLLKRVFTHPLDWQLLQECPVPVHLVNQAKSPLPRRIVAAVDPPNDQERVVDFNKEIVRAAEALALQCDAELHLLYAYDLSLVFMADSAATIITVDEYRKVLLEPFSQLADFYGVPADRRHFIMGSAVHVISKFVGEHNVDVVVMGTVQPKGLGKIIGDTTERTLQAAPCSILALRPHPEES